ncbi:MAG: heavy metal translocating P-type ATPase metal-binding domain-containing protein [Gillisia sp.]|nr:heavy metal translocating P-type ATPase metal-binding domain-containing protein [Gillisia sp.]
MTDVSACFHCGDPCEADAIVFDEKNFCCNGCKIVFEIFSENDLSGYYDLQNFPGASPKEVEGKYDFLDNTAIADKLLEFNDGGTQIITLYIPHIHCSSCIWILENLNKLDRNIKASQVNFPKKTVRVTFNSEGIPLKQLASLLGRIGYAPYISLDDFQTEKIKKDRSIIYKLGIAGFAFGNVMFLSFPEYFEVNEFWLDQYKTTFRWLMFAFSLPVFFYSASGYFIAAFKGLRAKILNIDVPLALGILVLFVRSTIEISFDIGSGFFDSLTGLVFFLLLGKYFQQKTYGFLSFERDYKSYFPIAVTRINKNGREEAVQVNEINKGDRLLIRNDELIPVDSILLKGKARIDYSFVTGEIEPVEKESGEKIFAGGKQVSGSIEIDTLKPVSQSYLTQLWSNQVFDSNKENSFTSLTNTISKYFTISILSIAASATTYWLFVQPALAMNVFTAILIIACPCALAMSAPFALGNILRIFGKLKFYVKNDQAIERLAKADTLIFDKTGTITANNKGLVTYEGTTLNKAEKSLLKSTLRTSGHPLSRILYSHLNGCELVKLSNVEEVVGQGIQAEFNDQQIKIGSASFVNAGNIQNNLQTAVHIKLNEDYKGSFLFQNEYREGLSELFTELAPEYQLAILSGDNNGEAANLKKILPEKTSLLFQQTPGEKLNYIRQLQQDGHRVVMVGDGLNDAGALKQSDVGIAISENVNVFSPACDAILEAGKFKELHNYIKVAKGAMTIIKISIAISFLYNIVGLYFAVTGQLSPVVAAILMPLSSISVVLFTTLMTNLISRKLN